MLTRDCVRVIIVNGHQVLVAKFKNKQGEVIGYTVPGGGIERNEVREMSVLKECREEVGIYVDNIRSLGLTFLYEDRWYDKKKECYFDLSNNYWYVADYKYEDKQLYGDDGDTMEYLWVDVDQVEELLKTKPSKFNNAFISSLNIVKKSLKNEPVVKLEDW